MIHILISLSDVKIDVLHLLELIQGFQLSYLLYVDYFCAVGYLIDPNSKIFMVLLNTSFWLIAVYFAWTRKMVILTTIIIIFIIVIALGRPLLRFQDTVKEKSKSFRKRSTKWENFAQRRANRRWPAKTGWKQGRDRRTQDREQGRLRRKETSHQITLVGNHAGVRIAQW